MADILEHLHSKYAPMSHVNGQNTPADFVCFGGDQLTEERARNVQKARADGRNVNERLDGFGVRMRIGMPYPLRTRCVAFLFFRRGRGVKFGCKL